MLDITRLKIGAAVKVRDFLDAYPFTQQPAGQVAEKFKKKLERGQFLLTQRDGGLAAGKAATARRTALKSAMVNGPLRHLSKIGKSITAAKPGTTVVRTGFGRQSQEEFQASTRAVVVDVTGQKELYIEFGLSEESLEELTVMLGEYEQAGVAGNAGKRASTGATAELDVLVREVMQLMQHLDGIIIYRFRDQPDVLGAWQSARNIAWPIPEAKPDTPSKDSGTVA